MKARVTFLLLAWFAAFIIVMALFAVFPLADLPLALRALVISGVLSISMTQIVIPLILRLLHRVF